MKRGKPSRVRKPRTILPDGRENVTVTMPRDAWRLLALSYIGWQDIVTESTIRVETIIATKQFVVKCLKDEDIALLTKTLGDASGASIA